MKWSTPLRALVGLYLAYLVISLLLVLPALNFGTPWLVEKYTGRQLHADIILFNPFTLALEVRNASLPELDGERFAAFDLARVDLSLASLWEPGIVLDDVTLDSLYLHVKRLPSGAFNFSDMLPPDGAATTDAPAAIAPADQTSGIFQLTIDDLALHALRLEVTDEQRDTVFNTHWDDLAVRAHGLSTVLEDGKPYQLELSDESGGTLSWQGHVSIPAGTSEGSLQLNAIDLRPFWRFAQPWLQFELVGGRLDTRGTYKLSWKDSLHYEIGEGLTTLSGLQIRPLDPAQLADTAVALKQLEIAGIAVNGSESTATIDQVTVNGLELSGWSEGDQVSLAQLFAVDLPADETPDDEPEAEPWQLSIAGIELAENTVQWRSEYTNPPLLRVAPVTARVENLNWPAKGETAVSVELAINDTAGLAIAGQITLDTGTGEFQYQLQSLPLAWFSPNIPDAFNAEITGGAVEVRGDVVLADFQPRRLVMDGTSTHFAGVIRGEEDALTGWDSVSWTTLAVDLDASSINLKKLSVNGYSGRLHIYEDGSINAQRVLEQEVESAVEAGTIDEEAAAAWTFNLPLIAIENSQLDFMDESMPVVFRTEIGDVRGYIADLSSLPGATTEVEIRGSVDGYAPVRLDGTAKPFDTLTAADLGLSFEGLDLVRLTPYSGTYAGYAIDRGTMNVDVRYRLDGSRLKGENSLVIDQLKLGEKVDSDKALDLPLKLGIALLTDLDGVIDIKVPVSGDLENPEFSLGGVIAGAVVNLITKAAAAPFKLLAGLVGSENDLQRINFPAGSAEPDEVARNTLMELSTALNQRPALKLVIYGRLNLQADREKLQRDSLRAELTAAGITAESLERRDSQWEEAITARYAALPGAQPAADVPIPQQYQQVLDNVPVADDTLLTLAADRAVTVKRILVNDGGIAADRAVIEQATTDSEDNRFSGAELDVDS